VTILRIPYITAWSDEAVPADLVFEGHPEAAGMRLAYRDSTPQDQDHVFGVLWARQGLCRTGQPEWRLVNTLRQRRAMLHNLCQVCGRPATDPATGRVWWVLADNPSDTSSGDGYTNAPPTCQACIPEAIATCPRLRRGAAVYTVAGSEPYGVLADVYRLQSGGVCVRQTHGAEIPLDAFSALEPALATQLLVVLHDLARERAP